MLSTKSKIVGDSRQTICFFYKITVKKEGSRVWKKGKKEKGRKEDL